MLTRQIILHVRPEFTVPDILVKGSVEDVEECLWIGSLVQQSMRVNRSNEEVKKISELKDGEIKRIQGQYTDKITQLLDELRVAKQEKERLTLDYDRALKESRTGERVIVTKEFDDKISGLLKEKSGLEARIEGLEIRKRGLEEGRDKDINDAVKKTEALMMKLVDAKEEQIIRMESAYKKLEESIGRQTAELTKLSGTLGKRAANVKMRGSDYEEEFREKLLRNYGLCKGFALKDTRLGMGHAMDYTIEMEGNVVMWELKNYTSQVPKAEVDKFLRDLKENQQARVGVMISRLTDIYGKTYGGPMVTEFDGEKMMIYISRFEEFCGEDENRVFQMLSGLFRVWWEYGRDTTNQIDKVEIIREIEKIAEDLGRRRTDWKRHKGHMEELIRWANDLMDENESRLDRLLKKLRATPDSVGGGVLEVPEGVFREFEGEKEQGWIQSIMKVCEADEERQIEVRELVELLSTYHKLSKDTIRSNVMSVIKDSAVVKKGVVKYIKGLCKRVPKEDCKIVFKQ